MRCLAACQTELAIRMLDEILLPSFEVEFLVESKPLARRLHDSGLNVTFGDLKRTALLLYGELRTLTQFRFLCGVLGGILLPLALLTGLSPSLAGQAFAGSFLGLICLLAGEIIERMTFFSALSAPRMPGGLP